MLKELLTKRRSEHTTHLHVELCKPLVRKRMPNSKGEACTAMLLARHMGALIPIDQGRSRL